ncbi:MutS protein-like protein 5-like [Oopsacas minuta]|uniref:MutS protein-like protein 5-like n=1 Tax=Oopsacas minuta TaxID=111878 RepID=A0AAV7K495_9METZ|nr:MutS protein-like protein 5-like [Oopsacas minuta]
MDDIIEKGFLAEDIIQSTGNQHPHKWEGEEDRDEGIIFLSLVWASCKLAASYYDTETCELDLLSDRHEIDTFEFLKRILIQIEPNHILTSAKQDERLKSVLIEFKESELGRIKNTQIHILPSVNFLYDVSQKRIISLLEMPLQMRNLSNQERSLYVSSLLPQESIELVRCIGALLYYIVKHQPNGLDLDGADTHVPVVAVKTFGLEGMLQVDYNVFKSLQIFKTELHPSVYKAAGCKEGLSLFSIANKTKSKVGSKLLKLWFLRPSNNKHKIERRQRAIKYLLNPRLNEILVSLHNALKHIGSIQRLFCKLVEGQLNLNDWSNIYKTATNGIFIAQMCRKFSNDVIQFENLNENMVIRLQEVAALIEQVVDFEDSKLQGRCVVRQAVDATLDEKKQIYASLPELLTRIAREELESLGDEIDRCNIVYLPQIGFLLTTPLRSGMNDPKDFDYHGLTFYFLSDEVVHYKSEKTRELDERIGDVHCDIIDIEVNIMHRLQEAVFERAIVLKDLLEFSAELDCLIALALWAKENNFICPSIVDEMVIEIENGRHPLQELCVCPFVSNDSLLGQSAAKIKLITGPNASGKSIYLKQVGIISYLAHLGSFIPADSARICLLDRIYTRIHTVETVGVDMSSYMIELDQVSAAVHGATSRSLVLLDEFGKGTETADGMSLMTAILIYWLRIEERCPFVLASTHFHNVIELELLPNSKQLEYQTMQVMQNETGAMVFLYKLTAGFAKQSYACHIAAEVGLPNDVIERANEVTQRIRENKSIEKKESVRDIEHLIQCREITQRFLALDMKTANIQAFLQQLFVDYREL